MSSIKICGITQPELALSAAELGVDMIGLVFAASRRRVGLVEGRAIRRALTEREQRGEARPLVVGVFVNEPAHQVLRIAREVGLDMVQLSGDESVADVARCAERYRVIKGFRFPPAMAPQEAIDLVGDYVERGPRGRVRALVDAHRPGEYGGTGHLADWSLAAALAAHFPIILAGGLSPANVAQAIGSVLPWGVDVSSGVEVDNRKDPELMRKFVSAVRDKLAAGRAA
jgi:phosphoribosylanthranilate isomerase